MRYSYIYYMNMKIELWNIKRNFQNNRLYRAHGKRFV